MAPAQTQVVTFVAGSALLAGLVFTIYLIKRRKQTSRNEGEQEIKQTEERDTSQNATEEQEDVSQEESDLFLQENDMSAFLLPDKNGLTVSTSWAILNASSDTSSPHLSPVDSDESVLDAEGQDDESEPDEDDDTQHATMLDVSTSESTILVETVPSHAVLSTSEQECVKVEELNIKYEELLSEHKQSATETFTTQEITEALMAAQNPSKGLTKRNAEVLVGLLTYEDIHLKHTAVQGIANCATFTNNQNVLREKDCLPRLAKLLELQRMAMWLRHPNASSAVSSTLHAVTNISVNEQNNKQMETCVPTLVDISLDKDTGETVCLSSLQALTNLSVTADHHGQYTRLVLRLYEFLQTDNTAIRLQSLKILINLSCNADMVPHLLAAKAPEGLLDFLHPSLTDEAVILRFVTLLANILHIVKDRNITSSSLPTDDKAPSPETMYTALLGISNVGNLKNKVFLLCKHASEDIRQQAARVHSQLK